MALESAAYVTDLVQSNPTATDPSGQGDDHLRLIKSVLKNTFPTLSAAITVVPVQLNLAGAAFSTSATDPRVYLRPQTAVSTGRGGGVKFEAGAAAVTYFEAYTDTNVWGMFALPVAAGPSTGYMTLDATGNLTSSGNITSVNGSVIASVDVNAVAGKVKEGGNALVPSGAIIMWAGSLAPAGWRLCDGTFGSPDLRSRFVVGASGTYVIGSTGGATSWSGTVGAGGAYTPSGSVGAGGDHNHGASTGSYALSVTDIPSHTHSVNDPGHTHTLTLSGGVGSDIRPTYGNGGPTATQTSSSATTGISLTYTGGGAGHQHSISSSGTHTHSLTMNAVPDHYHSISGVATIPPYYALSFIIKI